MVTLALITTLVLAVMFVLLELAQEPPLLAHLLVPKILIVLLLTLVILPVATNLPTNV
jgi:NhaP-type Na+/H+ and K+/H+ antiporter